MKQFWQRFESGMTRILSNTSTKREIMVLDGIRAIACLSVITYHISYILGLGKISSLGTLFPAILLAGDTGVTLFFVLSGFLLFLPYVKSLLFEKPWPSAMQFYLRRALRILPAYYVALFILILLAHPEYLNIDHLKQLFIFMVLFMDSTTSTYRQINGPFWTLAVEWQFYLVLPLIAFAIRPLIQRGTLKRRLRVLLLCLLSLVTWGVLSRWAGLWLIENPTRTFGLPPRVIKLAVFFLFGAYGNGLHGKFLEDFAIGMAACLCYVLATTVPLGEIVSQQLRKVSPLLWPIGLLWMMLLALWKFNLPNFAGTWYAFLTPAYNVWSELFFAIGYAILVLSILFGTPMLQHIFSWAPLCWIGHISFSLYIWHLPFIVLFLGYVLPHLAGQRFSLIYALCWLWVLGLAFPFSLLFFLGVERPWMKLSDHWFRRKKSVPAPSNT